MIKKGANKFIGLAGAGMALLMAGISPNLFGAPYAFPVPYVEKDQPTKQIFFKDLPLDGTIKIFTIDGELVKEIDFENFPSPVPYWDLTNSAGKSVASGVYLFQVESDDQNSIGKLVVVR